MAISLANIARGVRMKAPKIVVYGVGGIGKTTFANEAPSPIFLCTEEGQGKLAMNRFEPREGDPILRTWLEILECVELLRTGDHPYQTVVLDTLDFAEPLLWRHVCQMVPDSKGRAMPNIEEYGYGKGYGHAVDHARVLLAGFEALRNERNMAIIILAHSDTKKFEPPDSESYERYRLKVQERLAHLIYDWSDCVLFARYREFVTKDKEGFSQERRRAIGQGERMLCTEERPAFWAKNRYGLHPELPFVKGRAWHDFVSAIAAQVAPAPPVQTSPPAAAAAPSTTQTVEPQQPKQPQTQS